MTEKSIASSKSGSKQNYMLQEKTGFEKLSAEIKDSVFQVLYLILKEEDDSLFGWFFGVAADYMQMAAFAFNNKINSVWKANDLLNFVFQLFSFFQLQTYFSEAFTFTSYLVSFYMAVAVIVLMLINIIYVSYAFSKKRVSAIWPVMVLRSVTSIFFTVFFLPITELLLSMVECTYNAEGVYVHSNYPEVICFQGAHIIHATVAITVIFIFVILGFVVALAYFEIRMLTEDKTARQHSRGDVLFILNKIVLQLSFSFFSQDAQWWLVIITAAGAYILWLSYNIDEPYYRKEPTLFFKILTTYYLWTTMLMFFSKVFEGTSFDGGLITWVIGLPFIGVIFLTSTKSRINSLVQSTSRFKTSQDLMDHLRFVLQLVDNYSTDKNARILLTGYVEKHRDTCEEEDCPLKIKRKKKSLASEIDEMSLGLILVVDRMYQAGTKKFKASPKLRIFYAIFLLERMKKMKKAEQELAKAKELNPGFEDQFVIFRLTKMIADGLEGVDVVGLIAWDNYKNLYQEFVRESADLHKEFWSELREDSPNLHKLSYLGSRVNNAMSNAREYWNKVQKVRTDDPVILKTYGRFLIDIQNDVVEGYDLIEKAKKQVSQRISHQFAKRNSFDAGLDSLPYVEVVGSTGPDMGKIKQANLLFTVLVGVNRDEILEKKINVFMPELFSQYHDTFMKRYNFREDDIDIGYLDKDNNLFVRSRSGYIIPVTLRVSRLRTEETTNQTVFGAWFKTETAKRTYVHLICLKDGTIIDISASAVTVLNLSLQNVKKTKMNIDKIVPHALTDKGYREGGKEITYKLNDVTTLTFIAQITPVVIKDERNMDFLEIYANNNPGKPLTAADPAYGFIVKLDKIDKAENALMAQMDMSKLSSAKKRKKDAHNISANFERENSIRSDPSRASKAENPGDNTKVENDGQIIFGFNTEYVELEISELFQNDGGVKLDIDKLVKQEDEVERVKIDYGEGINLKKFQKGRLYDIRNDTDDAPPPIEDDEENSIFFKRDDDDLDGGLNRKRKDKLSALKRLVRDALEANQKNSSVATIRWITLAWLISIYVTGILQFSLLSGLFGDYENKIHVIQSFIEKLTEIDNINSYVTDFLTFNADQNVLTAYSEANYSQRAQGIKDSVTKIVDLTKELEEEKLYPFVQPFIGDYINITEYGSQNNTSTSLTETDAIFTVSSNAYTLLNEIEGDFSTRNPKVLTVLSNFYNRILPALRHSTDELQDDMIKKLGSFEIEFIFLFSINGIAALLLSVWGMVLLIQIDQQKEDVLFLFLEIPISNVDGISRKRDKFMEFFDSTIRQLQTNQENAPNDDNSTDSDELDEKRNVTAKEGGVFDDSLKDGALRARNSENNEEEEDALKDRKKLIKKFKSNQFNKAKSGLVKILCITVISLVYSISSSVSILVNKSEISNYARQYFTTNLLCDSILTAINLNRLMRVDSDFQIIDQSAMSASYASLIDLNSLGNDLGNFFLYVIYTNNQLEGEVTKLFFGNACEFASGNQTDCEQSLSQALKLGIFNLKEQVLKILMQEYTKFIDTSATTTDEYITLMSLNDDFKQYTFNILQQFNVNEEAYLKDILDSAANLQEILLIIYLVIITIIIVIFWMPYLSRLNAEVWRTTRMINMIPLDVVNYIPSIKRFLKGLIRGI